MTRKRAGSAAWTVASTLTLALVLGACGGDPDPKPDPSRSSSQSPAASSPTTAGPSGSPFPAGAPLPAGPWVRTPSAQVKIPKGFKGYNEMGVATFNDGNLVLAVYDPGGLGEDSVATAVKDLQKEFDGKSEVSTGTATVDGQEAQTFTITGKQDFTKQVSYGLLVEAADGSISEYVVSFAAEQDPTSYQDTIDSVLSSIRWTKRVTG